MQTIIATEPIEVEDGAHTGKIVALELRETPHRYIDVFIQMDKDVKLKAGYPADISKNTSLGQLLQWFGEVIVKGKEYDPEAILMNKPCKFITMTKDGTEGRKFANIIPASVTRNEVKEEVVKD